MARGSRGKKGGTKNKANQTPKKSSSRRGKPNAHTNFSSSDEFEAKPFTLRDEARNSERHTASWFNNLNLRHNSIGFVRSSEPLRQDLEDELKRQNEARDNGQLFEITHQPTERSTALRTLDGAFDLQTEGSIQRETALTPPSTGNNSGKENVSKFTLGASPLKQVARPVSPTPTDSSEEVILFKGRATPNDDGLVKTHETLPTRSHELSKAQPLSAQNAHHDVLEATTKSQDLPITGEYPAQIYGKETSSKDASDMKVDLEKADVSASDTRSGFRPYRNNQVLSQSSEPRRPKTWEGKRKPTSSMNRHTFTPMSRIIRKELLAQDSTGDAWTDTDDVGSPDEWNRSMLSAFDDMSTSDSLPDAVEHILSKRKRPSGLQYLVVGQDQSTDEARWLLNSKLTMKGASEVITAFEEENELIQKEIDESGDDDDSMSEKDPFRETSDNEDVSDDENEDYLDELDLIERRKERMTDEHLARLLSKQEELGLGSDELILFDADEEDELEDELNADFLALDNKQRKRRGKRNRRGLPGLTQLRQFKPPSNPPSHFVDPSDMLDGEDYHTYESMEQGRPVFGSPTFEEATAKPDMDLIRDLQIQWQNDRKKKQAKKLEREELRSQGLLGHKKKKNGDWSTQGPFELDLNSIREGLENFLDGEDQQYSLAPMPKAHRKAIHMIATQFGLKSKSLGGGKKRFTVLYKSHRSPTYFNASVFARVEHQLQRQMNPKVKGKGRSGPSRGGGAGITSGAHVMDGEIVGAAATEIGKENKGFGLLSKMGWSEGMALGSVGNEGRLLPVEHIVRKGRSGLG